MKRIKSLFSRIILMSALMLMGGLVSIPEGDGMGDPAGDQGAGDGQGTAPTEEEAAAAEATRVAALTPEAKAAEEAAAAEKAKGEKQGAPETYADFTLPDGQTMDKAALDAALPLFKEMNLTQEQAQRLVSLQAEGVNKANEQFAADKLSRLDAIKNDKEYGGEKFDASSEAVGRALNTLLTADEQADLKAYTDKFGPDPTLFRLMYRVATKALGEDTRFEQGGQNGVTAVNFYPNSNMK